MKYNINEVVIIGQKQREAVVLGVGVNKHTTKIKYITNGKIKNVDNRNIYKLNN